MRSGRRSILAALGLIIVSATALTGLTGCEPAAQQPPVAMFRPESPEAASILTLSLILLGIAAVAFVIVEVWLFLAVFRFRNRPEQEAVQTHGNLRLEWGWTIATAAIVIVVLVMTIVTMGQVTTVQSATVPVQGAFPGDSLVLRVVGHQWWWTFEYPQLNIVTANEVHVPTDRTIRVQLEAEDVIHSFWVPRLNGKTDTIPGQVNYTSFLAITPDRYHGLCGEFCGLQHAHMGFVIQAEPVGDFSNWVRTMQQPAEPPQTPEAQAGQDAFNQTCAGCHTIRGTQAQGKVGPDLTHFALRQRLAADMIDNTPDNLARWIDNPQAVKPGNLMPDTNLDQQTIDNIVAYLTDLK